MCSPVEDNLYFQIWHIPSSLSSGCWIKKWNDKHSLQGVFASLPSCSPSREAEFWFAGLWNVWYNYQHAGRCEFILGKASSSYWHAQLSWHHWRLGVSKSQAWFCWSHLTSVTGQVSWTSVHHMQEYDNRESLLPIEDAGVEFIRA